MLGVFADSITEHGFRPVFFFIRHNIGAEVQLLNQLEKGELAGLALWPQYRTLEECQAVRRVESLFPCVLVERYQRGRESNYVGTANRACYDRLTTALMDRGHRTIAYVTRNFVGSVMEDRYAGYCYALVHAGLAVEERLVGVRGEPSDASMRSAASDSTAEILQNMFAEKPYPTAIVCSDDWTATRVATELGLRGLRVPDDIAMATIDDTINPDHDTSRPWLSAVQDWTEMGHQTAQLLLARIAAPSKLYEQRFVRARFLFEEDSSGLGNISARTRGEVRT
jgi:DNA-binding LacI/PurR family transcriptional regulator